jgi:hypothetical protein
MLIAVEFKVLRNFQTAPSSPLPKVFSRTNKRHHTTRKSEQFVIGLYFEEININRMASITQTSVQKRPDIQNILTNHTTSQRLS